MRMCPRLPLSEAIRRFIKEAFKPGLPKREIQKKHGGKSPYIHSNSYLTRHKKVLGGLKDFSKQRGITTVKDALSKKNLRDYFNFLIKKGSSESTLKNNLTAVKNFASWLGYRPAVEWITKNYQKVWIQGRPKQPVTGGYSKPERLIAKMREPFRSMAILEYRVGLRVGEIKKVVFTETGYIVKGKGGRVRRIVTLPKERLEDGKRAFATVKEAMKQVDWKLLRESYAKEFKRVFATVNKGETYFGPHGLRANFARERVEEVEKETGSREEARKIVAQELGHNRISITTHYSGR